MEGAGMLARLYDFNRKPGSRALVANFLQKHFKYDDCPGMSLGPEKVSGVRVRL